MYMYVYMCMCMYMYTFWCMYIYAYMCTYMCMYMCMYMYAYVYVYDISTALWLMFLTCIIFRFYMVGRFKILYVSCFTFLFPNVLLHPF